MAQEGAMADEEDETIATQLWNKFKNQESVFANYSPFIVCLASGTLHPDVFLHCIGQDTHILNAFLNALRMAVECTDDKKEKIAIRALWKSVNERRKSYQIRVSEWGFELTIQQFSWGTTVTYTEFLMTVPGEIVLPYAKQNHAAYYLAAMAPWMRLYASVSKEINGLPDAHENSHMYSKWVDDYCSRDFEAFTLQIEDLLEKLSISLNYDELEVVESLCKRLSMNIASSS